MEDKIITPKRTYKKRKYKKRIKSKSTKSTVKAPRKPYTRKTQLPVEPGIEFTPNVDTEPANDLVKDYIDLDEINREYKANLENPDGVVNTSNVNKENIIVPPPIDPPGVKNLSGPGQPGQQPGQQPAIQQKLPFTVSGKTLINMLNTALPAATRFVYFHVLKREIDASELKYTEEEKEELMENAQEAAMEILKNLTPTQCFMISVGIIHFGKLSEIKSTPRKDKKK